MRGLSPRTLLPILWLLCLPAFSQESSVVRIGVAILRSGTDKISVTDARDRLVKSLNQQKQDKKWKISVQAVSLEASLETQAVVEAKDKNCQFVLYTRLTDLLTSSKYQLSSMSGGGDEVPSVSAKVEYQLKRVVDGVGYVVGSANGGDSTSNRDAVMQAMVRVAAEMASGLKSGGNVAHSDPAAGPSGSAQTAPKRLEEVFIGTDFCKWLPTSIPHAEGVRGVCEYAISLPQKMPNFICDQETSRYWGDNRVPRDLITALVRYEDGNESYSEVKLNGVPAPSSITESPGLWSTGEFGSNLRAIFDLHNQAVFEFSGENTWNARAAWVFTYEIVHQNVPLWRLHSNNEMLAPPYGGELWVDQKTGSLLRFRATAKQIPPAFPTQSAELLTDYNDVTFADGSAFQLPMEATIATRYRGEPATRNVVQFRNCHKFRARARMVLNVPPDARDTSSSATSSAELVERELAENNKIYAILREQALREDAVRLEVEHQQEMAAAGAAAISKFAALQKGRAQVLAREETTASDAKVSAPPEPLATVKVSVKLVPVSVVLRDSKGYAIGTLRREDFQLFDSGKPQVITSFSVEKSGAPGPRTSDDGRGVTPGVAPAVDDKTPPPERVIAYVFDDIHATFGDLVRTRDAAARHLAALRPQDRAGVFTTSGAVSLDFTSDRERLQQALQGLKPHPTIPASSCPPMSFYVADLIVNQDDLDALTAATQDAVSCAFGGMATSRSDLARAERVAKSTAFEVLNAGSAENQNTLGVLQNVIRRTAAATGTRSIVLVSPGFLALTTETRQAVMELVDSAVQAGIVMNTLDVKGLSVLGVAGNSSRPGKPQDLQLESAEAAAQSDVLAEFAYGTGGTFFHNNNDVDEGFRRTADAPEYIYVLGFSPQKLDGKFHKLKISLVGAEKLTVQARQGYYASKPETNR